MARNEVVAVKFVTVYAVLKKLMYVPAVAKLSKERSQPMIVPVCPLNVRVVLFVPAHTGKGVETVPATVGAVVVIK